MLLPKVAVAAALTLAALPVAAQYTVTGSSCSGGSQVTVHIRGEGFPTVGQAYAIEVTGPQLAPVLLGYSLAPIPPLDLAPFGVPTCFLYIVPVATSGNTINSQGVASFPAPPPAVAGVTVYAQAFVTDPGPVTLGATTEMLSYTTLPVSGLSGGEVIVTEYMRSPAHTLDHKAEWIEVYNTTAAPVDIEGWYLADDGGFEQHRIDVGGGGVIVPAGGFAVLGINADTSESGVVLDYEYSMFFLSDSVFLPGDQILLLDPSGFEVDRVAYSNPGGWPWDEGASASLDPGSFDHLANDDPANWCSELTATYFPGATGTPGLPNNACPAPPVEVGDVIVTEIMKSPVAHNRAEWFELYNTTANPIDVEGWEFTDFASNKFRIDVGGGGLVLGPGEYMVLGTEFVSFPLDYSYLFLDFMLGNFEDEILVHDASGQLQDSLQYDDGILWPDVIGRSVTFDPAVSQDELTNNDGTNWCPGTTFYTGVDQGTPGAPNDSCP